MILPYVYIIECCDGTYYTGYAIDLKRRLNEHNEGIASKYTRGRTPVKLVYYEHFEDKKQAMKREYAIKQYKKTDKEVLIKKNGLDLEGFLKMRIFL